MNRNRQTNSSQQAEIPAKGRAGMEKPRAAKFLELLPLMDKSAAAQFWESAPNGLSMKYSRFLGCSPTSKPMPPEVKDYNVLKT
jgi:hypothetical protein